MKHSKIAIIGAGAVGSTAAYALMLKNMAAEIALVDINDLRCKGEMLDLSDTLPFSSCSSIHMSTPQDARDATIIIFCAGIAQKPGQSRTELLQTNIKVVESVFASLQPINKDAIIIIVTNPVDILTYRAQQLNALPKHQIFGTGTLLDSFRLRSSIAQKIGISLDSIDTYVLGEHGDSQFVAWSSAHVDGIPLNTFTNIASQDFSRLEKETRQKAYDIIDCKGATFYGIAACVTLMCETIIFDQKRVLPLSTYHENLGVCLSLPVVLGEKGIEQIVPMQLNQQEQQKLKLSAQTLFDVIKTNF